MLELPKVASNTITLTPKEGVQLLGGQFKGEKMMWNDYI
jgi:hypothetical protein